MRSLERLYIANDGHPFSESNFNSLSQLGQSDKNPQESIGNKGIGFRSVLEIATEPEIYSRSDKDGPFFDGFCFGFFPSKVRSLIEPVLALWSGDDRVALPFGDVPLVDWDAGLIKKFRHRVSRSSHKENIATKTWLTRELSYLSPYLLPFPSDRQADNIVVADFERRGFATLICLPLKTADALALVRDKLEKLDDGALLFLDKTSSIVLDTGVYRRELSREQKLRPGSHNGREVTISNLESQSIRKYWVWTHEIALRDQDQHVQTAVQQLPGKWPDLREAAVSIGVRLGEEPEKGELSIFLPTLLGSGCATHINAPFFGDMSRTHIDFGTNNNLSSGAIYNRFLLSEAARLAVSVVHDELAEHGTDEARATIDLLAPLPSKHGATELWQQLISTAVDEAGIDIVAAEWFLSDRGWVALNEISLLPVKGNPSTITLKRLREHATFAAYVEEMGSRTELIEALSAAHNIDAYPIPDDLACTVESIADGIQADCGVDWNGFWSDADDLFDKDCRVLVGKRVLLGNDGELHVGGTSDCTVFFIPRRGATDDEEIDNENDIKEIPVTLRPFVAFLSDQIQIYEEKNGRLQQTRLRKLLLDSKLVNPFRRDEILKDVLASRTPTLPVPLGSPDATLCRDILLWALRLMAHLVERGKGEKSLQQLKSLPAPCRGGWYPLEETAFGPGWPDTLGEVTLTFLRLVRSPGTREARNRLLLPPSDEQWAGSGTVHVHLLKHVGVFDGLRLISIEPTAWTSRFQASKHNFQLPQTPPPAWSDSDWNAYRTFAREEAQPTYNYGTYQVQRVYSLPGLDRYMELTEAARLAMMDVVLGSCGRWEGGWETLSINRVEGNFSVTNLRSPLARMLSNLSWLGLEEGGVIDWCRPGDRWHVPAIELGRGRKWQFSHLRPLPGELANRLDTDARLATVMRKLGTPFFDPETKSASTQLLDALADAVVRNEVPNNWDVFLGQVRSAWRGFEPVAGSAFPKILLTQRAGSKLTPEIPSVENHIYLPDLSKSLSGHFRPDYKVF